MPTVLDQDGYGSNSTTATQTTLASGVNLPAGTLVVMGLVCMTATPAFFTASDPAGNEWAVTAGRQSAGATTNVVIATSVLKNTIPPGSVLRITSTLAMSRHAFQYVAFSNVTHRPVTFGQMGETSTTAVVGGTTTPSASAIVFGISGFINSGRTLTPAAGWAGSMKTVSAVGSGDRALQLVWRDGTASTAYNAVGSLDTSGTNLTVLGRVDTGPPPSGGGLAWTAKPVKVWTGTAWSPPKPVKVWTGAAWVTKPLKVWMAGGAAAADCNTVLNEPFNNLSGWTTVSAALVAAGRNGTGVQLSGIATIDRAIPPAYESASATIGLAWRVTALSTARPVLTLSSDAGTTNHVTLAVGIDGSVYVMRGGVAGSILGVSTPGLVTINTWVYLELQATLHDTTGSIKVRVNGTEVLNLTNVDTRNAGTKSVFDWLTVRNQSGANAIIDDLYLTTGPDCTFQGDHVVCTDVLFEPFNDLSAWVAPGGGWTVIPGRTGTSAHGTGAGITDLNYTIPIQRMSAAYTLGFAYRCTNVSVVPVVAQLRNLSAGLNMYTIRVNADGSIQALGATNQSHVLSTPGLIAVNTWYFIELKVMISNTAGYCELRVGGNPVATPFSGDTNAGFTELDPPGQLTLTNSNASNTVDYDDLYLTAGGCAFRGDTGVGVLLARWGSAQWGVDTWNTG